MLSTGEIKEGVRLAQQYNIHIYRALMNGLVESSTKVSQLKTEYEEYIRSGMMFFDRLYQIQDAKIPFACVREEQIGVFRDQIKRNDRLRQEVHSVQRNLWNMRMMGQKIPMTKKHLIVQGYPELCVTTRSDQVPLTVFCDYIMHKYNLHNEGHIVAMLNWAEDELNTQKATNPVPIRVKKRNQILRTFRPSMVLEQPVEQEAKLHDVKPVCSIDQQTNNGFAMKLDDIKELDVLFQVLGVGTFGTTETMEEENVPCGDIPIKPTDESGSQPTDDITILSFNDVIDLDDQIATDRTHITDKSLVNEEISLSGEKSTPKINTQEEVVHDLLSFIQNIPAFGVKPVPTESDDGECGHNAVYNPYTAISTDFEVPLRAVTKETTVPCTKQDLDKNKESHHIQYDPRCRQEPLCSWEELMKRFTKPDTLPSIATNNVLPTDNKTEISVKTADVVEKPSPTGAPTTPQLTKNTAVREGVSEKCDGTTVVPQGPVQPETPKAVQKAQRKSSQPCPIDGSERSYMYATVKRKQHVLKKGCTDKTTSAEANELIMKREEQLRALELKKQRAKNILNQQYDGKSSKCKDSSNVLHHKIVKIEDTGPQVGKVFKTPDFSVQSQQVTTQVIPKITTQGIKAALPTTRKRPAASSILPPASKRICQQVKPKIRKQETKVPAFVNRKRPAAPSSPLTASKRACRQKEPRIMLRIFKEAREWNVEQVFD